LAVSEEGGDNYEVFLRGEGFVFSDEPFVVGNCCDGQLQVEKVIHQLTARIPAWIYYSRRFWIAKCLICYVSIRETLTGLELPVAKLVGLYNVAGL